MLSNIVPELKIILYRPGGQLDEFLLDLHNPPENEDIFKTLFF